MEFPDKQFDKYFLILVLFLISTLTFSFFGIGVICLFGQKRPFLLRMLYKKRSWCNNMKRRRQQFSRHDAQNRLVVLKAMIIPMRPICLKQVVL